MNSYPSSRIVVLLGFLLLTSLGSTQAGPVVISEFMASNTSTLADEEGSFEDWIEIHNASAGAVNLSNWALTDTRSQPGQWRFPETNLNAGAYLVVFASGKDRRTPGAPLHTNFKLSSGGEYLALIEPDGATVATEFSPSFPTQLPGVSYGLDPGLRRITLLADNATGKLLVPTDGSLGTNWVLPDYDDSSWTAVTSGVGFVRGGVDNIPLNGLSNLLVGYWKFDETSGKTALDASGRSSNGNLTNFPGDGSQWVRGRMEGALQFRGGTNKDYVRVPSYPAATTSLTVCAWVQADGRPTSATIAKGAGANAAGQFRFGLHDTNGDLEVSIRTAAGDFSLREGIAIPTGTWQHVAFSADAGTLRLFRNGRLISSTPYTGNFIVPSTPVLGIGAVLDFSAAVPESSTPGYWLGRLDELAIWNRAVSTNEIAILAGAGAIDDATGTRISTLMGHKNSSCYLRFPFVVENPADLTRWRLRLRYDDGFVAWLNGEELVRRNAPDLLSWDSTATEQISPLGVPAFEEINLAAFATNFVAGTNILAIQGLNVDRDDLDFLIQPALEASSITETTNALVYFTTPTPGADNVVGVSVLGPIIAEVTATPAMPTDADDLTIRARVTPAFAAVTNITLHYRIMYSNEVTVPMFDDGAHNDLLAGDGVYAAVIPASASTSGQMVRYFVSAQDAAGRFSRLPLFNDPLDADEYFGTVVGNPAVTTKLPVFHWFVKNPSAAETQAGTRCSLYYAGEFYDNIFVRIRGGTSLNWSKKSYKVEFNEDHEFLVRPGQGRVTEFDMNTTFTDKSYVRAVLASDHMRDAGLPAPEIFHIHLRQNSAFYSVALFTEQPDKDFLVHNKLDPVGALYKGGPGGNMETISAFEKKTRRTEGNQDLAAFLAGLSQTGSALENWIFDNINVPEVVNYMATMAVTQDIDGTDKNYFLYRDTEGTGEWAITPWDIDLTFGPDALNTDNIVANRQAENNAPSHPFIGSPPYVLAAGKYQKLIDDMVKTPRTRAMLLHRLRAMTERYLVSGYFERRIEELYSLIAPDVAADLIQWGNLGQFSGRSYTLREALDRIKIEYLTPRIPYLTGTNIAAVLAANPGRQPFNGVVQIVAAEFNPAGGNQLQEYLCLSNPSPFGIDISGWRLTGGVDYTFRPGTVILSNNLLFVARNVAAFRARSAGPRGGQGLFVQGDFAGQLSARGETVSLSDNYGRLTHAFTYAGSPSAPQQFLRITEIMYHPADMPGSAFDPEQFEFLELRNISTSTPLDLTGVRFLDGVVFDFGAGAVKTLGPGERALVVRNLAAFTARYGKSTAIAGVYSGQLQNNGDRIRLVDGSGEEILDFSYDNKWFPITDGPGFALAVLDENAEPDAWGRASNWKVGARLAGTPGLPEPLTSPVPQIVINEVLTRNDQQLHPDAIELLNLSPDIAQVGGWFLTDDFNTPKKFRIPGAAPMDPGSHLLFTEAQFNPTPGIPPSFALGSDGDEVWLFSADSTGELTGYVHGFKFGPADDGVSFGRHLISTGEEHFVAQSAFTPSGANAGPKVGPLVINEIMYHPPEDPARDTTQDEFLELLNLTRDPVPLFDPANPGNTWKISGGISFTFPGGKSLEAGASLLLVGFDPTTNAASLTQFRARYDVPAGTAVLGPYVGKLNDGGENLELKKPTTPIAGKAPYVLVDRVSYRDSAPWPSGADGIGLTLQRKIANAYGDDPANWIAAPATAGRPTVTVGAPPAIFSAPQSQTVTGGSSASLGVLASGTGPLRYQWRHDGQNLPGATNSVLEFTQLSPNQRGDYDVVVWNDVGSQRSPPATLTLVFPLTLLAAPQTMAVRIRPDPLAPPATNATFSVSAFSPDTLSYQWRFDGSDIPNATNSSLTVKNVTLADSGNYSVVVADSVSAVIPPPARLIVMIPPVILIQPVNVTVVTGGTAILSIQLSNTVSTPLGYRWRKAGATVANVSQDSLLAWLVLTNVRANATYDVIITNLANLSGLRSLPVTVTVVPDSDLDGIPDSWETDHLLDPNSAADALLDLDHDGMTSLQEYLAGTDPNSPASVLHFETSGSESPVPLRFDALANHTYTIEWRESPSQGRWSKLRDVPARSTNHIETVEDNRRLGESRVYRLLTPRQPDGLPGPAMLRTPRTTILDPGGDAVLDVLAEGSGPLRFQWLHDGSPIPTATNSSLAIRNIQLDQAGSYSVVVSDETGLTTNEPPAFLALRPLITAQPQSQSATVGQRLEFSVTAVGNPPLHYQWSHDGKPIRGETNPTLLVPVASRADAGAYTVTVTHSTPIGPAGVVSSKAVLDIH